MSDGAFDQFRTNQDRILSGFAGDGLRDHGTLVDPGSNPLSGLHVGLDVNGGPRDTVMSVVRTLGRIFPEGVAPDLHVSIGDQALLPESLRPLVTSATEVMQRFGGLVFPVGDSIERAVRGWRAMEHGVPELRFHGLAANRTSVVAWPIPSAPLFQLVSLIGQTIQNHPEVGAFDKETKPAGFKRSWGTHATLLRQRQEHPADSTQVRALLKLVDPDDVRLSTGEFAPTVVTLNWLVADGTSLRLVELSRWYLDGPQQG